MINGVAAIQGGDALSNAGAPRTNASLPPKLNGGREARWRAMRRRTLRQDAFLILKLATYSSGFAGSNGFPITENDLYDVAGGVINFGGEARAGSRGRYFQTAAWWLHRAIF